MRLQPFAIASVLSLALTGLSTGAAFAQARSATAKSGQETKLGEHMRVGKDCGPPAVAGQEFTVVKQPANGSITTRQATAELKNATGPNEKCKGKSFPAVQVYYKSKDGWKGSDSFSYKFGPAASKPQEQTVNVTVN